MIITDITEVATRDDLLDRALVIHLPRLPDSAYRPEKVFWAEFEQARPRILAALLAAAVHGLRTRGTLVLSALPRMADFAEWGAAVAEAIGWSAEEFIDAYAANRSDSTLITLESSPVAQALLAFMRDRESWKGTAEELLANLEDLDRDEIRRRPGWPKQPHFLGSALRRLETALRRVGIEFTFGREGHKSTRMITITATRASSDGSVGSDGSDGGGGSNTSGGCDDKGGTARGPYRPFRRNRISPE